MQEFKFHTIKVKGKREDCIQTRIVENYGLWVND
jgi:hypothetical protein